MKVMITRPGYRCEWCGHEWIARGRREPRICARCKRPLGGGVPSEEVESPRRIDHEFWNPPSLDEIIERQGGPRRIDWDNLKPAAFWPDDCDVEDFIRDIYEYRQQSRA
jgi:hypothetical protein